mmetsp:Transcript_150504/g.288390  ORF Transcript_150504/g.288390 Transcript_150504/m.288390 type:complete len:265 (-) Transcript_150504:128-922(-)
MIRTEFLNVWERIFTDDEGKDTSLKASDGTVPVHGMLLANLSEPLKCMLRGSMREAETREIDMSEFTSVQLRFILRLAYTGHIDSADWVSLHSAQEAEPTRMITRRRHWRKRPLSPSLSPEARRSRSPTWDNHRMRSRSHSFEVFDRDCGGSRRKSALREKPPLELFFAFASFAKKYDVPGFLSVAVERIKERVDCNTFDEVMCFAISLDVGPLKMFCIRYAEKREAIRIEYDRCSLSPPVMFELQALWEARPISSLSQTQEAF